MTKPQDFTPTPAMRLYAFQKAKLGEKARDRQISKLIGVRPETISRWKQINGFSEWAEETVALFRTPIHDRLEQVALERLEDPRFWMAMAEKYGYLTSKRGESDSGRLIIDLSGKSFGLKSD